MGGINPDIIKGPVGMLIGLVVWLVVTPLLLGAINGWYLQTIDTCELSGERFDRVVLTGSLDANEAWGGVTSVGGSLDASTTALVSTIAYKVKAEGTTCVLNNITRTAAFDPAAEAYTPIGSVVKIPVSGTAADVVISGGKWAPAGGIFTEGGLSSLIAIILQAAGLAPPIAVMLALGSFGQSFIKNVGGHPILAAIITVVVMLLVATLVNSLVPFLTTAFTAVDPNRFEMFSSGLGNVAIIVKRFYGVVLVAGLIMVAWSVIGSIRGKNALSGGQRM